jgi:hypothetical protein
MTLRRAALIVGFYGGLALLALYHPLFHLPDFVPTVPDGSVSDYYHFHWNYWWIRHALTHGLPVYQTEYVMAPFVNSLALHTLTPFWYPVWALIEPILGTSAAVLAIMASSYTLAGVTFYALLRAEGVRVSLALLGGALLELSPMLTNGVYWTNLNIMGWFWLPLLLLTWRTLVQSSSPWPWAALLGVTVWAMLLTDVQYAVFASFLVVPYGLWTLIRPGRHSRARLIGCAVLALIIALLLLTVAGPLIPLLEYDRSGLANTPADRAVAIPFPQCYIWHCDEANPVGAVLLPLLAIALIVSLRLRGDPRLPRRRWLWLALFAAPFVLSMGASITVFGVTLSLPYQFFHDLLGGMFRYPERLAPVFLIPAVLFIAQTFSPLIASRHARWIAPLVLLVAIADARLLEPIPVAPLPPHYTFYDRMAAELETYVIVDVPTAGMSGEGLVGEARFPTTQFAALWHGQRVVNGHISRINTFNFMYMRDGDPMMSWLGQRRDLEPDAVAAQMRERIPLWPIGYFVIHQNFIRRDGGTLEEIFAFFNQQPDLVCPVWVEGDAVVYRTTWHPSGCPPRTPSQTPDGAYVIDIGAPEDVRYLGQGWHAPETVAGVTLRWAGAASQADLYLDLPPDPYRVTISAQSYTETRTVRLLVNGVETGEPLTIAPDALNAYTVDMPQAALGDGRHVRLTLAYDAALSPSAISESADSRLLALAVEQLTLQPIR